VFGAKTCFAAVFHLGLAAPAFAQTTSDPNHAAYVKAGEQFKNVRVLNDMPADQMGKVMNIMSASLGVNCSYCHEGTNFAAENVGHKDVARSMLKMTMQLNEAHFSGESQVSCNTCHRGQAIPNALVSTNLPSGKATAIKSIAEGLSAKEVLARFDVARGGSAKQAAIKNRHVIAERVEPNGKTEPEELWQSSDGHSRMVTRYGNTIVAEGCDAQSTWKTVNDRPIALKVDEGEQIQREAQIAMGRDLLSVYSEMVYESRVEWMGRPTDVLKGASAIQHEERLYFDAENGLLVRRTAQVPTVLGAFEYEVLYKEYREYAGVLHPTRLEFAVPNIRWARQVSNIECNVGLDEKLFRP
jgi:hypothetical protein